MRTAMSRRAAAPPPIFRRGLAWKAKVAAKVARKRRELQHEDKGLDLRFSNDLGDWATVGEHIDAYHRYNMLVGEADGGEPLGEAAYRELERRCAHAAQDRLFCTWRHRVSGMDCVNVGPFTRCFCGHSYRAHAFYENASKKVACRVPGCRCPCFSYVYHRGGQAVRCMCKHELDNHRIHGRPTRCRARGGGREHVVCKTGCDVQPHGDLQLRVSGGGPRHGVRATDRAGEGRPRRATDMARDRRRRSAILRGRLRLRPRFRPRLRLHRLRLHRLRRVVHLGLGPRLHESSDATAGGARGVRPPA